MSRLNHTPEGQALSGTALDMFRVVSLLLTAGDRLIAHLGLTSARWQVLGAVVAAERPQPVAWLARDMGQNRQNVQRIINDLHVENLVAFQDNPHHRRAQLVVLTTQGREVYDAAMRLQAPWFDGLASGLSLNKLKTFHGVLSTLRERLEHGVAEPLESPRSPRSPRRGSPRP